MKTIFTLIFFLYQISLFGQMNFISEVEKEIINCDNNDCLEIIYSYLKKKETKYSSIIKNIPTKLPLKLDKTDLTSIYGNRFHPIDKHYKKHKGIDLKGYTGQFIYCPADGVVSMVKVSEYGYGKRIKIVHPYGFETFYAHLSLILVKKNQIVKKGEVIGLVGTSGKSTASHLHFELFKNNKTVNPSIIIKNL